MDRPPLGDLPSNHLHLVDEGFQSPRRQDFGDKVDLLSLSIDPRSVKADDILVVQPFQEPDFVDDTVSFVLWDARQMNDIPGNLNALFGIVGSVYILGRSTSQLLTEPNIPATRRPFHDLVVPMRTREELLQGKIFLVRGTGGI